MTMDNHGEKQVGSNLTGAAIPGKPGHQRDIQIPIDPNLEIEHEGKKLGDVHPTDHSENSQKETNAKKENGT